MRTQNHLKQSDLGKSLDPTHSLYSCEGVVEASLSHIIKEGEECVYTAALSSLSHSLLLFSYFLTSENVTA
jgi:hypothetical protein